MSRLGRSFTAAATLNGKYPVSWAKDSKLFSGGHGPVLAGGFETSLLQLLSPRLQVGKRNPNEGFRTVGLRVYWGSDGDWRPY